MSTRTTILGGMTVATLGAVLGVSLQASAADGFRERTAVNWSQDQCMVQVLRTSSPILHLDYEIPQEDAPSTPVDELADSRTHQFFTFCRSQQHLEPRPGWISDDDVQRATDIGLLETMVSPENILDSSMNWMGCIRRVTADDDRVPITFSQAAMGVDWDTTDWDVGPYIFAGYTFDPHLNLWSDREGVIRVMDSLDEVQNPPAGALMTGGVTAPLFPGESTQIEGCAAGMRGTSVSISYRDVNQTSDWKSLSETVIGSDGLDVSATLNYDAEFAGERVEVRMALVDPLGRTYEARLRLEILMADDPTSTGSGGETEESSGGGDDSGAGSCNCDSRGGRAPGWLLFLLPFAFRRRFRSWRHSALT